MDGRKEREDAEKPAEKRIHPGDKLFILGFLLWLFCRNCVTAGYTGRERERERIALIYEQVARCLHVCSRAGEITVASYNGHCTSE